MKKRNSRQEAIREIVRSEQVRTQRELVEFLEARGFVCTQATVSRDVTEIGLKKLAAGTYVLAEDLHLQRMLTELVIEVTCAGNLVLLKASPGTAQGVAAALDQSEISDVLGSVAGDDTVLVVARDEATASSLVDRLDRLRGVPSE